jgi:hypothetical protein
MAAIDFIQSLRARIDKSTDRLAIRTEILELIYRNLDARRHTFDDWEKVYFSNAITALTLSVHELKQASHNSLAVCLDNLEKAITPAQLRESTDGLPDGSILKARYEQFADALECLRLELVAANVPNVKIA